MFESGDWLGKMGCCVFFFSGMRVSRLRKRSFAGSTRVKKDLVYRRWRMKRKEIFPIVYGLLLLEQTCCDFSRCCNYWNEVTAIRYRGSFRYFIFL